MTQALELEPPPPCRPPLWARGGHLQTIFGHLLPSSGPRMDGGGDEALLVTIELGDGDRLTAHHLPAEGGTLLALFHGLGGSADSGYMRRAAAVGRRLGLAVLSVDHRGCGAGAGLARGPYHAGRAEDLAAVVAHARSELGARRVICLGFSLSANALLLQLGRGIEPLPDAAIAVSPPVDLEECTHRVHRGLNRVYELRYVRDCRRMAGPGLRDGWWPGARAVSPWASLYDFDEAVTAPAGGFSEALDYYRSSSSARHLAAISRPTVLIHARDDPFVPAGALEDAPKSPALHFHLEEVGGHMGFLTRDGRGWGRWMDRALDHYLRQFGAALSP